MVRPTKDRKVEQIPEVRYFKPAEIPKRELEQVSLTIEEVEALRLKDKEELTQAEAAERMEISRPTFQRILTQARRKVSSALVGGKAIEFRGGNYKHRPRCKKCGHEFSPQPRSGNQAGGQHRHGELDCPDCESGGSKDD